MTTCNSNYSWHRKARILMIDGYNPPMYPDLELDADRLIHVMKELNANAVRTPAVAFYAYYPTDLFPSHPELGKRDVVGEVARACKKEDFKFIPYIPVGHANLYEWVQKLHPDWMLRRKDGSSPFCYHGSKGKGNLVGLCLNSPSYRETIKKVVEEVISGYEVDVAYFDGPVKSQFDPLFFSGWGCFCEYCEALYRKETGKNLPEVGETPDWKDSEIRSYYL